MDANTDIKFDETKYSSSEIDRSTPVTAHSSRTIIKYITPRVITSNTAASFHGSFNSITGIANMNSNYPPTATAHGLATLVHPTRFSTISAIHSIDGERIIDELRDLSRVTETLGDAILQHSTLEAHTRAQELQIELLENHSRENSSVIEKMFQTEMESAQKLLTDSLNQKATVEVKLNEASQTTIAFDEQYKELLTNRNQSSRELFDLERHIAQNNAESEFLKRRIRHFEDEIKFYILKNRTLHDRKVRLRYELDQQIFAQQSLKMEVDVLENDKITNEDIRIASLDDIHTSIDTSQIATIQPSKSYSQQLSHEVQRIREEYEKKMEVCREELHRRFELELHRYQIQKSTSLPTVTKEHELKLEQYQHENNDVVQQIAAVRGCINQVLMQIESMEKQIITEKRDEQSTFQTREQLDNRNQLVKDRERQLEETLRTRNTLKEEVENYKKRLERYPRQRTIDHSNKRTSIQEMNYPSTQKLPSRLSFQEVATNQSAHPLIASAEELWEEGTLTRYSDFNVDQDCHELHRLLTDSNIDEGSIIRILCNRSSGQRLQIRDRYNTLFSRNLSDALELLANKNLSKLLRILLLSPIERDCFELRRILKGLHIDTKILAELFFTRSSKHLQTVRDTYPTLMKNTLEQDIIGEDNDPSKRIFLALLQSNRPEDSVIDEHEIAKDVRDLHQSETDWKTDESTFLRLLCTRSNLQLKQIFEAYRQSSGTDIEQALQVHTEKNLRCIFLAIIQILRNLPQFFACVLKNNIKGAASDIGNLNRIIVSRCEIDMVQIKSEYEKMTNRSLYDHIQIDTSGNYKRALLELIRQRIEPTNRHLSLRHPTSSSKHSEESATSVPSNLCIKRSFVRSTSDRTIDRRKNDHDDHQPLNSCFYSPFDSNNQAKSSTILTITTKRTRTNCNNQHAFAPMPNTTEHHSKSKHHDK